MILHLPHANGQLTQGAALVREVRSRSVRQLTLRFGLAVIASFGLLAPPWPGENGWQLLLLAAWWVAVCWIVD